MCLMSKCRVDWDVGLCATSGLQHTLQHCNTHCNTHYNTATHTATHTTTRARLRDFRLEDCSVLQCVAVCCSVLQCVAVCCSVLQCVAVCCSVLQCVQLRDFAFGEPLRCGDIRKKKGVWTQGKSDFAIAVKSGKRRMRRRAKTWIVPRS